MNISSAKPPCSYRRGIKTSAKDWRADQKPYKGNKNKNKKASRRAQTMNRPNTMTPIPTLPSSYVYFRTFLNDHNKRSWKLRQSWETRDKTMKM